MKINNVKLANAVRVGTNELTYFNTIDTRGKTRYDIELDGHLIKVTDTKDNVTKYTSLYNTVSFDMVADEPKKTKPDGTALDLTPRATKARGRDGQGTD